MLSEYYQGCQPGWEKYGDYCYMANVNKLSFEAAQDECAAKSGDLVSIHDAAESAFVQTLINEGPECPDDGSGSWVLDSQVGMLDSWAPIIKLSTIHIHFMSHLKIVLIQGQALPCENCLIE